MNIINHNKHLDSMWKLFMKEKLYATFCKNILIEWLVLCGNIASIQ